jgi:hypothetical protein
MTHIVIDNQFVIQLFVWLQRCGFEFLHQFHTTINPNFNFNDIFNQPDRNAKFNFLLFLSNQIVF